MELSRNYSGALGSCLVKHVPSLDRIAKTLYRYSLVSIFAHILSNSLTRFPKTVWSIGNLLTTFCQHCLKMIWANFGETFCNSGTRVAWWRVFWESENIVTNEVSSFSRHSSWNPSIRPPPTSAQLFIKLSWRTCLSLLHTLTLNQGSRYSSGPMKNQHP